LPVGAWLSADRQRGFLRVREFISKIYPVWKVELADLDGDGTREVLLGIWSNRHRHDEPEPHRTVWVLRWQEDEGRLAETWRGSALARPMVDFSVQHEQLVAHERLGNVCWETTYEWTGFGFAAIHSRPAPCQTGCEGFAAPVSEREPSVERRTP
jgi:hypothetical protein